MTNYVVALPKGGTGKSSLSAELTYYLAAVDGQTVLAGDLDQQGNLTRRLGITNNTPVEYTLADVLRGVASPLEAAIPGRRPGVFVLAGGRDLTAVADAPPSDLVTSLRFSDLSPWPNAVWDTQPNTGRMLDTALAVADEVIVPVACSVEAFDQVETLEQVLSSPTMKRINPGVGITRIVPTLYDARRLLDRDIVGELRSRYGALVTQNTIRESVRVKESYTSGQTVSEYAPDEPVSTDIAAVVHEILGEKTA